MRILIVGAGALGGLVGAHLSEAGEDLYLLEVNQARAKLLNESGLFLSEADKGERCVPLRVVCSVSGLPEMDLLFVAVKSYETAGAIRQVARVIGPDTLVLSMQNGIGNTQVMAAELGPERVLCGITYHSIQHTGPNRLRYRPGIKPIQIAPYTGVITPPVLAVGEVFRRAGLETNVVENIDHVVWQKLLHNAVVNPVSALTGLTCRELLDDVDLQAFMRDLCAEIIQVMRARGVPIMDEEDPYRPVISSQRALGKNRPSMWQDLARGMRTEVDAINGAIVDEAERLGLLAPHNLALVRFIHSRERQKILRREEITRTLEQAARRERPSRPSAVGGARFRPAGAAEGDQDKGLPSGRVPLQTAPRLKRLIADYYTDLQAAAEDPKRIIVWCSGMGPVEIVRALGMTPYFPENHAALIGSSRLANRYIPRAISEGFSQFASSAMTCDIGATLAGDSPLVSVYGISGPPRPDALVYNTNHGQHVIRWFEYYGRRFEVPVLGIHTPASLTEVSRIEVDSVVQQTYRLISHLEELAGRRLEPDRLAEAVEHASRATALWREILLLAQNVPSPLTFFDLVIHMAPMILLRGTRDAVEYYTILKAELEDRVARHQAAVPGERYRFYWEGAPIWGALRRLAKLFLDHQVAIVASTFSQIGDLEGLDPTNPVESTSWAYTSMFTNRSEAYKASFLVSQFREFGVDAVVYHDARTAPEHSNVHYGLEARLRRTTGLPSLVLEADSHDMRLFSIDPILSQLEEFLEHQQRSGGGETEPGGEGIEPWSAQE
jgi:2-dehydropantoate 2-reductase